MNEDALRALVREAIARHLGAASASDGRRVAAVRSPRARQPLSLRAAAASGRAVPDRAGRAVQSLRLLPVARTLRSLVVALHQLSASSYRDRTRIRASPAFSLTRRIPSSVLARLEAACDVDLLRRRRRDARRRAEARASPTRTALICVLTDQIDRDGARRRRRR